MAKSYSQAKGRGGKKSYLGLPKEVISHENFVKLSAYANKLVIDLGQQYKGHNNGDLCATWVFMVKRGWKSKETLNNALRELEHYGIIVQTQAGGLNRPSLYAFTWNRIDKADKHSNWKIGDTPRSWNQPKPTYEKPSKRRSRKKTQVRLTGQYGTAGGAVSDKIRLIK